MRPDQTTIGNVLEHPCVLCI